MPGYQSSATGGHYIGPGQYGVVTAWATCRQSDWDGRQCQKARDSRCSSLDPPGPEYRGDNQVDKILKNQRLVFNIAFKNRCNTLWYVLCHVQACS